MDGHGGHPGEGPGGMTRDGRDCGSATRRWGPRGYPPDGRGSWWLTPLEWAQEGPVDGRVTVVTPGEGSMKVPEDGRITVVTQGGPGGMTWDGRDRGGHQERAREDIPGWTW